MTSIIQCEQQHIKMPTIKKRYTNNASCMKSGEDV